MKNKKYWEFKNQVTNQETEEVEEIELAVIGNDYDEVHAQRVEEEKADIEGGLKVVNEE